MDAGHTAKPSHQATMAPKEYTQTVPYIKEVKEVYTHSNYQTTSESRSQGALNSASVQMYINRQTIVLL